MKAGGRESLGTGSIQRLLGRSRRSNKRKSLQRNIQTDSWSLVANDQPSPGALEALEELQHRHVDLVGPLLLGPVAAAGKDQGLAELGHESRQVGDDLVHAAEGEHEITVAGDVEGGDGDGGARIGGEELPVAIDVAIPVEPAAKARASEFLRVEVEVGLGEPARQRAR